MIAMTVLVICCLLLLLFICIQEESGMPGLCALLGVFILVGVIFIVREKAPLPTALDVYRDKTTLEITYKQVDSLIVPVDSIVVWKD